MEIILAVAVTSAVILFGALISIGNERQRKAIDNLREQVVAWAVQDLKIKREHLASTVDIPDPLSWLNKIASKVCGCDLQLQILEAFETPPSLVCTSEDRSTKIVFSPYSPANLRQIKSAKQNRLSHFANNNPLLFLPKNVKIYELSVLNSGFSFDIEISFVWKELTGKNLESANRFWMYEYS